MVLYAYYKVGLGLFTNTSGTDWEDSDSTMICNEQMLINIGAMKLQAYKLYVLNYEYPINSFFAQQPTTRTMYRYVDVLDPVKYVSGDYVTDTSYFTEVQYLVSYLI